jgi:hypothetical protein
VAEGAESASALDRQRPVDQISGATARGFAGVERGRRKLGDRAGNPAVRIAADPINGHLWPWRNTHHRLDFFRWRSTGASLSHHVIPRGAGGTLRRRNSASGEDRNFFRHFSVSIAA